MPVTNLAQTVPPHQAAFVHIGIDAVDSALGRVLPNDIVALIAKHRRLVGIHGDHEFVVVNLPGKILVVEIPSGVEQRFLFISFLYHVEKLEQRVAESRVAQPSFALDVYHGYQVLVARPALSLEIIELFLQFGLWAEKVVRPYLQPVLMGQLDVLLVSMVDAVAPFSGFQIDKSHFGVLADGLPKHLALIMAKVDAVNVRTSILAMDIDFLGNGCQHKQYARD